MIVSMHECMVCVSVCSEHGKKLRGFTDRARRWPWTRYRWPLHKLWSSPRGLSSYFTDQGQSLVYGISYHGIDWLAFMTVLNQEPTSKYSVV